jgi:hypothetical protein
MFERYTERARRVIFFTRYEASHFGSTIHTVASQAPAQAELKFNVWIVAGSSSAEVILFAFILQADGRILSVGGPNKP